MSMLPGWSRAESGALVFDEAAALREVNADLLAACKRALLVENSVTQGQERALRVGYVDMLRAAVAKAEAGGVG
jgi:hypothetical protein